MSEEQKRTIGALWLKKSKTGVNYFGGTIEVDGKKYFITIFKNNYKKEEKHPDYTIAPLTPVEEKAINETPVNNADLPF